MSIIILLLVLFSTFFSVRSQTCLSSPDEYTWSNCSGTPCVNVTLNAATFFEGSSSVAQFTTRVFDRQYPGKTLRFERGMEYIVHFYNDLGAEDPLNSELEVGDLRLPNHTNLHTHGLHISGEEPSDYVFHEMAPGDDYEYIYTFPDNHNGGIAWYHPHFHGSSFIQVNGGAIGAIIVDEDQTEEGLPDWLVNMNEIVIVMQEFDLVELDESYSADEDNDVDATFSYDTSSSSNTAFTLVNGEYQPTICMDADEWLRWRIVYTSIEWPHGFTLSGCDLQLLAKDTVWIDPVPREVNEGMWFTPSSRAEVAVYCPGSNSGTTTYELRKEDDTLIAYVRVTGTATTPSSPAQELTSFNPIRPSYLKDLTDWTGPFQLFCPGNFRRRLIEEEGYDMGIPEDTIIDGVPGRRSLAAVDKCTQEYQDIEIGFDQLYGIVFDGTHDSYLFETQINTVIEFHTDQGGNPQHPFHMHVNHVQLIDGGIGDGNDVTVPGNWTQNGDFLDTVYGGSTVRFYTADYGGHVTLHCHILEHEDQGAMGVFLIHGGCAADGVTDYEDNDNYTRCGDTTAGDGAYIYDVAWLTNNANVFRTYQMIIVFITFVTFFVTLM